MLPSTWKKGTSGRFGDVIFRTEAPYSARVRPIAGPAIIRQSSRTRMPLRIWGRLVVWDDVRAKGAGGELDSRFLIVHGGSFRSAFP